MLDRVFNQFDILQLQNSTLSSGDWFPTSASRSISQFAAVLDKFLARVPH